MIVVTYLLRQSITLYKNLGGGLEPLSPIASAATVLLIDKFLVDKYKWKFYK